MGFTIIIPARFDSSRLPGKPLLDIAGKSLIQHVYECAMQTAADRIIVATEDTRIESAAKGFGAQVCMTSSHHRSGTERIAEVIQTLGIDNDETVVNLQGDEPMMPPQLVSQVAQELPQYTEARIATLCSRIHEEQELFNPNIVKVVRDLKGYALYFSRSPIPWDREDFPARLNQFSSGSVEVCDKHAYYKHIGLYAYTAGFVTKYVNYPMSVLEKSESLEQLRAMENGDRIYVGEATMQPGIGVDTEEDLLKARKILAE